MILDTSAIVAIVLGEPTREALLLTAMNAPHTRMSAATYVELHAVLARKQDAALGRRADRLLTELGTTIEPFDHAQAQIAARAYREYGRGSNHPAAFNLGDCYAYALAAHSDEPLLFVGKDFGHTDVTPARLTGDRD